MKLSAAGLELLKKAEGFRSRTYEDLANRPTIGYGHLLGPLDACSGTITLQEAETLLLQDVSQAEQAVTRMVEVPLTQGQFDALVDFTFNLGAERLRESTLLAKLNDGDCNAAAMELLRWDHSGAKEVAGLKLRREAEYRLWTGSSDPMRESAA